MATNIDVAIEIMGHHKRSYGQRVADITKALTEAESRGFKACAAVDKDKRERVVDGLIKTNAELSSEVAALKSRVAELESTDASIEKLADWQLLLDQKESRLLHDGAQLAIGLAAMARGDTMPADWYRQLRDEVIAGLGTESLPHVGDVAPRIVALKARIAELEAASSKYVEMTDAHHEHLAAENETLRGRVAELEAFLREHGETLRMSATGYYLRNPDARRPLQSEVDAIFRFLLQFKEPAKGPTDG